MNESVVEPMESPDNSQITPQPGWIEEKRVYQRKAVLFKTLAILWIVPSLTSLFVVFYEFAVADGMINTLKGVRLEQWLSFVLLLLHPVFIYLAIWHKRHEIPTERVFLSPDPNYDPKNLY